ncbi:hypothetical protein G8S49_07785 [Clostridium botulinum C]|uniref:Uncharacterized protein n=5 Tax=Clostridium TaxID=1485 RepID=C4IXK8_CLOBO|nr:MULTISPECIES: hypothetical protein [Clostridium]ACT33597.1 hypothetical protein CLG_0013 [Clostridium botulinum D str. 1873]AYF55335.1 hypothetical protein DFH04_11440 [Clostridium novyi]KEI06241.1 hypothetical protein Z957_p0011 [Clostridium sp. K25]KEI08542.1 hypothetical protein Z958_12765 [Clostridium novyi B str. NCTC 9691]KEI11954.1 hypothetical protein Z959_12725 [Clostridium novyi B str. ATCC 27606]
MASKNTGSLISSIASSLNKEDKKNIKKEIKETKEEKTVNRSYNLKMSTVKKLQRLKVLVFEDSDLTYNEIVDKAICDLYKRLYIEKIHKGETFDAVGNELTKEFNKR